MATGAELFINAVWDRGVRELFTLVGDHLNDVLRCAGERGMRVLDMRHESAVVHAADAWARTTRRPALSLVTGGPGHTNALTGVATALGAGSPVIAVSGSRPQSQGERGAFQDIDQLGMIRSVVKWAAEPPSAEQIPFYVARAWAEATSGRMGPVHLTIPVDVLADQAPSVVPVPTSPVALPAPDDRDVERALEILSAAERPLVIAGGGVWWSRAEDELRAFAEAAHLPVYTLSLARGAMPDSHPLAFGYGDPALNRAAARAFAEADVVLILGKRIDFRLSFGKVLPQSAKLIQIDIHAPEIGMNRRVDVGLCGDLKTALQRMLALNRNWPKERAWVERLRGFDREWRSELDREAEDRSEPIHPAALFRELRSVLPDDVLYSWDGGDFVHWGRAMLPAATPGGWVRLGPLATIGASLPNAIALQMANPGKPVVMITGDGALGFYIAELDTLVRHGLPVVIIVGNDAGWGLERELQGGNGTVGCELRATRYDVVMRGFGGEGENIDRLADVAPAVRRAFASRKPYLLNVNVRGVRSPFTRWKLEGPSAA